MKPAVADWQTRVLCLRIVPVTGATIYLTDHPRDLAMAGHTYLSTSGYQFTGYSSTDSFAPASIDIEGISGLAGITRAAIGSGLFDGARCYVFATSWAATVEDQEPITAGIFGKSTMLDDRYQIGGVSLVDALNQVTGATATAPCQKTFCGQEFAGCKLPIAANTVTGTLTSVTSAAVFRDSTRSESADTFGAGTIAFTSGPNAGLKQLEIKSYAANGAIETFEPFYYLPAVGNAYTMIRGCRKREIDCKNRWNGAPVNNILNFGGFSHVPTSSTYGKFGQG